MQRIDDLVVLARPAQVVMAIESARGQPVQVREHLQRGLLPGVDLSGQGSGHGNGSGNCPTERRIVESGTHHVKRDVGSLEGGRIARSDERGRCDDLRGPGPDGAIPQQPVDLAPGGVAGVAYARQPGEGGERIAQ